MRLSGFFSGGWLEPAVNMTKIRKGKIRNVLLSMEISDCIEKRARLRMKRPNPAILRRKQEGIRLIWFWSFVFYSFLGFVLEVTFAWMTGGRMDRKGLLLLPLCPVYGLGACGILWLAPLARGNVFWLFLVGAAAATAAEYLAAVWYEQGLGVSFWDYTDLPGNIQGRVCIPFTAAWGLLSLGLVRWVHPWAVEWMVRIPVGVTAAMAVLVSADFVISSMMMKRTGDRRCLQWYRTDG